MIAKNERTNSTRTTAITVGILFIIATLAGVLSVAFLGAVLADPDNLISFAENSTQVIAGALLQLPGLNFQQN